MNTTTRILTTLLFMLLSSAGMQAQQTENELQQSNADTIQQDTIDRMAEDFVTVMLCIADPTDWRNDFMGINGHAFLRLICPTFGMDYCFSYEAESAKDEMTRFLKGDLRMGMFRVKTEEYIKPFQRWQCAIRQYRLNLPPEAETRLWEIMDRKVDEGEDLQFDLVRRGCTQTLVQFVEQALGTTSIDYPEWTEEYNLSRREIVEERLHPYPWIRFLLTELLIDDDFDENVDKERKIIYPTQAEEIWQKATVEGRQLAVPDSNLVEASLPEVEDTLITPSIVALLLLLLAVASLWVKSSGIDLTLLGLQFVVGLMLLWLVVMSDLPGSRGLHLLPLYTPLTLMLWRWRGVWAKPYGLALAAWIVASLFFMNIHIEPAHLIFAAAICVVMLKVSRRPGTSGKSQRNSLTKEK